MSEWSSTPIPQQSGRSPVECTTRRSGLAGGGTHVGLQLVDMPAPTPHQLLADQQWRDRLSFPTPAPPPEAPYLRAQKPGMPCAIALFPDYRHQDPCANPPRIHNLLVHTREPCSNERLLSVSLHSAAC